jgi:hypothetical protein
MKGYYGKNCAKLCPCNGRGACDEVNEKVKCFCDNGYEGDKCQHSKYF